MGGHRDDVLAISSIFEGTIRLARDMLKRGIMKSINGRWSILAVILITACATFSPAAPPTVDSLPTMMATASVASVPAEDPTPEAIPETRSEGLQLHRGQGFSLRYPLHAQLEINPPDPPATHELRIIGPEVAVKPGDADWVYSGPGYEMTVRTYDNPDRLGAEQWARSNLLVMWQRARDHEMPTGGVPVTEDGEIDESQVGVAEVAGQPAFWANFFAGDSIMRHFYIANGQQVVEVSFLDTPPVNQPLDEIQQDIYALIMGTFSFPE
jgi:hypothetical protein